MVSIALHELAESAVTSRSGVAAGLSQGATGTHLTTNDRLVKSDADHAACRRWARSQPPCDGEDYLSLSEADFLAL